MPVSFNQYRGEIGSFYNQLTNQITELTICFFNILINFTKNVSGYIILTVNMFFNASTIIHKIFETNSSFHVK